MEFLTPKEERMLSRGPPINNAVCLVMEHLDPDTTYYLCVCAYNSAGESGMSEIINSRTRKPNADSQITGLFH